MDDAGAMRLGPRRDEVLERATDMVRAAWASFDAAREVEPAVDDEVRALMAEPLPRSGRDPLDALADAALVLDRSLAQARPRYLAYVGSSGLEVGAVADLLAHSYDINLAVDAGAATLLEHQTVAWLAQFLGFPAAAGSFTSGGTLSNLTALAAARERAVPSSRRDGLVGVRPALYCSVEAHYSVMRAAELLGLGSASVRDIPIDPVTRGMRPDLLAEQIAADVADGVVPIAVVATAGTTLTGAVDPMLEIADVCARFGGVWMHVDGAYGLPAAATSRAPLFAGLDRADSVSVDAHKWMFVPKACSAVLVRDPVTLTDTFSHDEAYMPHEGVIPNSVDMTLEYSRPLRALKLWLAFRVHGAEEFREALERNLTQARMLYRLAAAAPDFEVLPTPPALSIVPLRHRVEGCPDPDAHNLALTAALQDDGRVYVSPAVIDGGQWLRPCFTNVRTTAGDVEVFLSVARELGGRLCPDHV
ncbi:MAG: pyridoxal-dependent decarboxylase [Candidatus Nanopelagicales bacterium]